MKSLRFVLSVVLMSLASHGFRAIRRHKMAEPRLPRRSPRRKLPSTQ